MFLTRKLEIDSQLKKINIFVKILIVIDSAYYISYTINICRHDPVPSVTVLMTMLMAIVLLALSLAICEIFINEIKCDMVEIENEG